jgi:hypothetical protein
MDKTKSMSIALLFLFFHGILGGIDVIVNHELNERLPVIASAKKEELLHSIREGLFAVIFLSLAWFQWKGSWTLVITGIILAEIFVTFLDALTEDRTRQLSFFERVIHTLLFINTGIYISLLAPVLWHWYSLPFSLTCISYGWISVALSFIAVFSLVWCVRDLKASLRV